MRMMMPYTHGVWKSTVMFQLKTLTKDNGVQHSEGSSSKKKEIT